MPKAPADILEDWIDIVPSGRALDLGAGDGEVSAWLSDRGFAVDAVERQPLASLELAAQEAAFTLHQTDLAQFIYPIDEYSLVTALAVLHFLRPTQLWDVADRILGALAPGGVLIAEVFTADDPGRQALMETGAKELEPNTFALDEDHIIHYFEPGELHRVFAELEVLGYGESRREDPAADPPYRAGATLVARKR